MSAVPARPTVLLAAGGTGGHLFPAFSLAQELARREIDVELATDERGDRYGMDFPARRVHQIPSATLQGRSPSSLFKTGWTLARGIRRAFGLLGEIRPGAVIGFGGYPSFPPLIAARLRGIPTAIHEQNAVMGRANRMLAKRVTWIAASFETTRLAESFAGKMRFTGNPVRDQVIDWSQRAYRPPEPDGPVQVLVFGGSQGARYFSDTVPEAIALASPELRARLRIVQQCRAEDLEAVRQRYADLGVTAELASFFRTMPEIMAASQLVIARAGASTVAELTVMGRPAILVPLPHALDNDQKENAARLAAAGGGWSIPQAELTANRLIREIEGLIAAPVALESAAAGAKRLGRPDAVLRLADLVEEMLGARRPARTA